MEDACDALNFITVFPVQLSGAKENSCIVFPLDGGRELAHSSSKSRLYAKHAPFLHHSFVILSGSLDILFVGLRTCSPVFQCLFRNSIPSLT